MLSVFEKGIIELIKSALKGCTPKLDEGFDFEKAYEFAQKSQITPLVYYGAVNLPNFMDTLVGKKFFKSTMNMSFYCTEQNETIKSINEAFKSNRIQHMMLKGTMLRDLYIYPEMRLMSDADILVKEEDYKRIKPIMTSLGFTEKYESDHELVWKKNELTVELHKRLIPSYNMDYYRYFGDGWKLATIKDEKTNECFMSKEDCFIYTFVHYAKHYRDAGIGIKHLIDFYVYLEAYQDLDWSYINKELEKLQLLSFWKNTKRMLDVWFYSCESDEISEFMTLRIFNSGAYGTSVAHIDSESLRLSKKGKNVKLRKWCGIIFPPYSTMCLIYPFLKKLPILLPFMWIVRMFVTLFKPSRIKRQKDIVDKIGDERGLEYQKELNYVGLDFNFD